MSPDTSPVKSIHVLVTNCSFWKAWMSFELPLASGAVYRWELQKSRCSTPFPSHVAHEWPVNFPWHNKFWGALYILESNKVPNWGWGFIWKEILAWPLTSFHDFSWEASLMSPLYHIFSARFIPMIISLCSFKIIIKFFIHILYIYYIYLICVPFGWREIYWKLNPKTRQCWRVKLYPQAFPFLNILKQELTKLLRLSSKWQLPDSASQVDKTPGMCHQVL